MKTSDSKYIIVYLLIMVTLNTYSQNLSFHKWENRLLLFITDNPENKTYLKQIELFREQQNGLNERKLKIYHVLPEAYKIGLFAKEWQNSNRLYRNYRNSNVDFEIILIGLDGRIKLRQSSLLSMEKLFGTIDAMPMRRTEIEEKNK